MNKQNKEKYDSMLKILVTSIEKGESNENSYKNRIGECIMSLVTAMVDLNDPEDEIIKQILAIQANITVNVCEMVHDMKLSQPTGTLSNCEYDVQDFEKWRNEHTKRGEK